MFDLGTPLTPMSRRAAAGRAELLAKGQHTDRLENPAKLRRFGIGGRIGGRITRNFEGGISRNAAFLQKMLHFGKLTRGEQVLPFNAISNINSVFHTNMAI